MSIAQSTGINGFGRFGLKLLRYWLDRHHEAAFRIDWINDDTLSLHQALQIINTDRHVRFDGYHIEQSADGLRIRQGDGSEHKIRYTHAPQAEIPWIGEPDVFFECSGKLTDAPKCDVYLQGRTRLVMISATSWNADLTAVYGFNHDLFDPDKHRKISYGSCTVNGYVPLASFLHGKFGVIDSDLHVVHNIPEYKLAGHQTLERRTCTLERSAPLLLDFLDHERNFAVIYSVVPWTGPSMIDFRFRLDKAVDRDTMLRELETATQYGPLKGLYAMQEADIGPEEHEGTPYSAVLIRRGMRMLAGNLHLQGYFDTENSVNRYYDLANHCMGRLTG